MGLKVDADFLRFLTMGAIGVVAVANDLRDHHGHRPIELERYAMSNKIWQTKVKRLRMPDLLCVNCGLRVEVRAKSKLAVVLSHSEAPGRGWDAGGTRDDDLYAFLRVDMSADPPAAGRPSYFSTQALRATRRLAKESNPKAASEGSEVSLKWPGYVPSFGGTLHVAPEHASDAGIGAPITIALPNGKQRRYTQWSRWPRRVLYLQDGDPIAPGSTIVAGIVDLPGSVSCPGPLWQPDRDLRSTDGLDRFVAVKALGHLHRTDLGTEMTFIAADASTDWRLRVEALGTLSRLDIAQGVRGLLDFITQPATSNEARMEAVLVLTESPDPHASAALAEIASVDFDSEVRSAAVWGLGQGAHPDSAAALQFIGDEDELVAVHAAAGIETLDEPEVAELVKMLNGPDDRAAEAANALLLRFGHVRELATVASDPAAPGRLLAIRSLGDVPRQHLIAAVGATTVERFSDMLAPMWRSQDDWVRTSGRRDLELLASQHLYAEPFGPPDYAPAPGGASRPARSKATCSGDAPKTPRNSSS